MRSDRRSGPEQRMHHVPAWSGNRACRSCDKARQPGTASRGHLQRRSWHLCDQIEDLVQNKECITFPLGQETERAEVAIKHANQGRQVAVISSGDPGIYAMASVVVEMLATLEASQRPEVVIVPGVSALTAVAALLGAPLGHDFAV